MKSNSNKTANKKGITLIEVMLYSALLSILMTQIVQYALYSHQRDIKLLDDIQGQRGFIALVAVILMSLGILVFSIVTITEAGVYADSVYRHELRIQADLNAKSCIESLKLITAKDYFLNDKIQINYLGCEGKVVRDAFGNINLYATSTLEGVSAHANEDIYLPVL